MVNPPESTNRSIIQCGNPNSDYASKVNQLSMSEKHLQSRLVLHIHNNQEIQTLYVIINNEYIKKM